MYTLHEMGDSGNCYKIRLLMHQLNIPFERVPTDILQGQSRTESFLAQNPNGKVPLLILPDGRPLAESNAILSFLARGTAYLPDEPYEQALVLQWLFFEQYSHEPYIAVARFLLHYDHGQQVDPDRMKMLHERGHQALAVMDGVLSERDWFAGSGRSVADIALYAYTHVAGEGGFDLAGYPAIRDWIARVAGQPGHVTLTGE